MTQLACTTQLAWVRSLTRLDGRRLLYLVKEDESSFSIDFMQAAGKRRPGTSLPGPEHK